MSAKRIKRILYGIIATAFLFVGGRELFLAGLNLESVASSGVGLMLGYMAVTGKG